MSQCCNEERGRGRSPAQPHEPPHRVLLDLPVLSVASRQINQHVQRVGVDEVPGADEHRRAVPMNTASSQITATLVQQVSRMGCSRKAGDSCTCRAQPCRSKMPPQ